MIHRLFLIASALVVAVIALAGLGTQQARADGLDITVTPETASRLVNTTHVVTASSPAVSQEQIIRYTFRVISGPNAGVSQALGGCIPSTCTGGSSANVVTPVSWFYTGSGGVGTDTIEVCGQDVRQTELVDCDLVEVTWFRDGAFPIGGAISAQAAENRARAAAAAPAAVVPPATGTGIITPPSTGDAGLLGSSSSSFALAGMAAFALAGLATLKLARAKS